MPHASAVAWIVSAVAADVASPLTTSTSGISGAGLKKCMPTIRSGRFMPAPSAVIENDDVFVAMMHAGVHDVLDALEELALRGEVLDDGFDDELRDADIRQRHDGRDARQRRVGLGTREAAFRHLLVERFRDAALRGVARAEARIVQLDAMAVERRDLRDAGAHRPRADDGDDRIRLG